jgi:hypothetical protein
MCLHPFVQKKLLCQYLIPTCGRERERKKVRERVCVFQAGGDFLSYAWQPDIFNLENISQVRR